MNALLRDAALARVVGAVPKATWAPRCLSVENLSESTQPPSVDAAVCAALWSASCAVDDAIYRNVEHQEPA